MMIAQTVPADSGHNLKCYKMKTFPINKIIAQGIVAQGTNGLTNLLDILKTSDPGLYEFCINIMTDEFETGILPEDEITFILPEKKTFIRVAEITFKPLQQIVEFRVYYSQIETKWFSDEECSDIKGSKNYESDGFKFKKVVEVENNRWMSCPAQEWNSSKVNLLKL
jgi:hypothetical protein